VKIYKNSWFKLQFNGKQTVFLTGPFKRLANHKFKIHNFETKAGFEKIFTNRTLHESSKFNNFYAETSKIQKINICIFNNLFFLEQVEFFFEHRTFSFF